MTLYDARVNRAQFLGFSQEAFGGGACGVFSRGDEFTHTIRQVVDEAALALVKNQQSIILRLRYPFWRIAGRYTGAGRVGRKRG